MRAITLWQPWAWAITHADKRVENRTWSPPESLIGEQIAIHAGKQFDESAIHLLVRCGGSLFFGGVVGVATLAGVTTSCPAGQDTWFSGPVGWILEDVVALADPVPCRGFQGLWALPEAVHQEVLVQLQGGN